MRDCIGVIPVASLSQNIRFSFSNVLQGKLAAISDPSRHNVDRYFKVFTMNVRFLVAATECFCIISNRGTSLAGSLAKGFASVATPRNFRGWELGVSGEVFGVLLREREQQLHEECRWTLTPSSAFVAFRDHLLRSHLKTAFE